jgi:ABC-type sulfate transport system permease component
MVSPVPVDENGASSPALLEGLRNGFASACCAAIRVVVIRSTISYFHRRIPPKGKQQWQM